MTSIDSDELLGDSMSEGHQPEPETGLGGSGPPAAAPPSEKKRWPRAVAALVVVAAVAALIAWAVWPSSTPKTSISIPAIAPQAVETTGGQEMIALLHSGLSATYHARYEVTGSSQAGSSLTLEVWQSPPNLREDTVITHGNQVAKTESFLNATGGHLCTQVGSAPWSCRLVPKAQSADSGVAGVLGYIADTVSGHGVAITHTTIDGMAATCFTVQSADQPRLCANADGAPLLVTDHSVTYKLQSFSDSVPSSAFSQPTSS